MPRRALRQREIGVRLALGPGRVRLIRQLLTESLLLGVIGGLLGLLVAFVGTKILLALASSGYQAMRGLIFEPSALPPQSRCLRLCCLVLHLRCAPQMFGWAKLSRMPRASQ